MLGKEISIATKQAQWGSKLLPQLSKDLASEYPDLKGFSVRNLKYMRFFYEFYTDEIGQQPVAQLEKSDKSDNLSVFHRYKIDQIPWGHNIFILQK